MEGEQGISSIYIFKLRVYGPLELKKGLVKITILCWGCESLLYNPKVDEESTICHLET